LATTTAPIKEGQLTNYSLTPKSEIMTTQELDVRIEYDEFVAKVRPSPDTNEQVQFLTGYVGRSSKRGHIRLYVDATLSTYIEIPTADILHALPKTKEEDPLGGSRLWVKKESKLAVGNDFMETRTKEEFTKGSLMDYYREQMFGGTEAKLMAISPGGIPERVKEFRPSRMGFCEFNQAGVPGLAVANNNANWGGCLFSRGCLLNSRWCPGGSIACMGGTRLDLRTEMMDEVINPAYQYQTMKQMFGY
jgi:hypothetical protein